MVDDRVGSPPSDTGFDPERRSAGAMPRSVRFASHVMSRSLPATPELGTRPLTLIPEDDELLPGLSLADADDDDDDDWSESPLPVSATLPAAPRPALRRLPSSTASVLRDPRSNTPNQENWNNAQIKNFVCGLPDIRLRHETTKSLDHPWVGRMLRATQATYQQAVTAASLITRVYDEDDSERTLSQRDRFLAALGLADKMCHERFTPAAEFASRTGMSVSDFRKAEHALMRELQYKLTTEGDDVEKVAEDLRGIS